MKMSQFLFLSISTIIAVYFMNISILSKDFLLAGIFAFITFRNLHFAYKVTRFIRLVEKQTKK
ncbi:DUF3272 family protein [Streptococcus suis]|uniref:DUF3272 family protein n=1 Tax=Streptococcus suis TaxID=1307 RepID=UPI000C1A4B8E|nr:DUF3272 family protein [Streptococcus suis]HEL9629913.1 DUF3272 family protein [Streptococcus suis]